MAEKKRVQKISSYLNINYKSFQGKITLGFLIISVFIIIGVVLVSNFRGNIYKKKQIINNIYNPTITKLRELEQKIDETQVNLLKYTISLNDKYRKFNGNLWIVDIHNTLNELLSKINEDPKSEIKALMKSLTASVEEIRKVEENIEIAFRTGRNREGKKFIDKKLDFQIQRFKEKLYKFLKLEESYIKQTNAKLTDFPITYYWWFWLLLILAFALAYSIGVYIISGLFKRIREIRLNLSAIEKGDLPEDLKIQKDEFERMIRALNQLKRNLIGVKTYAEQVGEGIFDKQLTAFEDGSELGQAIQEMGNSLQKVSEEDNKRSWATRGLAEFGEILRENNDNIVELAKSIVAKLTKHLNVIQAGLFVVEEYDKQKTFELIASYAYEREKYISKSSPVEEGLLGRVYFEKNIVYLDDIPKSYTSISSGLGEAEPDILLLLPLLSDENEVQGIIELATFKAFEDYEIEFLRRLAESISSTINFTITTQNNKKLLEDSQMNSRKLLMQEKMLRGRSKQLEKMQKETFTRLKQAEVNTKQLQVILRNTHDAIIVLDQQGCVTTFNRGAVDLFEYAENEVKGERISMLVTDLEANLSQRQFMNYDSSNKNIITGEYRILEAKKKSGEIIKIEFLLDKISLDEEANIFLAVIRLNRVNE